MSIIEIRQASIEDSSLILEFVTELAKYQQKQKTYALQGTPTRNALGACISWISE